MATTKNLAEVALEARNSPQMIFNNYLELLMPADAKACFEIFPAKAER